MALPCILVIDDDHDTRVSLRDILEEEKFCVCSAANGKDALEMLMNGSCRPSVIVLDLMMPVMSGLEFLKALENNVEFSAIPILVTSAGKNQDSVGQNREFFSKPLDFRSLKKAVAKYKVA